MNLPDKPSELLRLAMTDLEFVERNPKYRIDMSDWHRYDEAGDVCEVCFAGAVMANTLKVDKVDKVVTIPNMLDYEHSRKLWALDDIRQGDVRHFLRTLGLRIPETLPYTAHPSYLGYLSRSKNPEEFQEWKNFIVSFIGILEAEGL